MLPHPPHTHVSREDFNDFYAVPSRYLSGINKAGWGNNVGSPYLVRFGDDRVCLVVAALESDKTVGDGEHRYGTIHMF